ncbi:hypothetical protein PINS_up009991 [Pythium insidiosum]|nr:hypothetical protein PINS_up009991 [Pythium insidiosum]
MKVGRAFQGLGPCNKHTSSSNTMAPVLNRMPREKLPQVLTHVLTRLLESPDEIFSNDEAHQLMAMLGFSSTDIDDLVASTLAIFVEAASFGGISAPALRSEKYDEHVISAVEQVWRKRGAAHAERLATSHQIVADRYLKRSNWELNLEIGQRKLCNQSNTSVVFQLETGSCPSDKQENEDTLSFEMNHTELLAFFRDLNSIQVELDAAPTAAA